MTDEARKCDYCNQICERHNFLNTAITSGPLIIYDDCDCGYVAIYNKLSERTYCKFSRFPGHAGKVWGYLKGNGVNLSETATQRIIETKIIKAGGLKAQ